MAFDDKKKDNNPFYKSQDDFSKQICRAKHGNVILKLNGAVKSVNCYCKQNNYEYASKKATNV